MYGARKFRLMCLSKNAWSVSAVAAKLKDAGVVGQNVDWAGHRRDLLR
jgi:hypothetical protein